MTHFILLQYELYDEEQNLDEVNSDDSDEEHDESEWQERKIADVGSSPSEESGFPHHEGEQEHETHDPAATEGEHYTNNDEEMKPREDFGEFVSGQES